MNLDFEPFLLSFELASVTTILLFFFALPLAWYLSQTTSKFKPFLETITALPIVLPPSVLGFYLLWALSDTPFIFNFESLVIASCFYSLPFMVQPLQSGFASLNKNMIEASYIVGKSSLQTLFFVALPNIKPALLNAIVITFAHTVGEFGVVLMVGGSIPGETKVASVAIYEFVENLEYDNAHIYSMVMLLLSFSVLFSVYYFNHKQKSLK